MDGLRNLRDVEIEPVPGLNIFLGANGAGKSSLLEGLSIFGLGRSFRTPRLRQLIAHDRDQALLYIESPVAGKAGIGLHKQADLQLRLNDSTVALHEMLAHFPFLLMEPGSWDHFSSGPLARRRLLDWGLFHVEHDFLWHWQRYQRALEQRNSLLRRASTEAELYLGWEQQMAQAAERLSLWRENYLQRIDSSLQDDLAAYLPEFPLQMRYNRGWEGDLAELLASKRHLDLQRTHTLHGAHRADISLTVRGKPAQEFLSRGQMKILTTLFRLQQMRLLIADGLPTCLLVDDFSAELDANYRQLFLQLFRETQAQIWLTSTDNRWFSQQNNLAYKMFHVEQGRVYSMMG